MSESTPHYPCPCCGYATYLQKPPSSQEICPVCFWEDLSDEAIGWDPSRSLANAQEEFLRINASSSEWLSIVRPPSAEEARPAGWRTFRERRSTLENEAHGLLSKAFANVRLGDGISLRQARVLDDYGSPEEFQKSALQNPATEWSDVPQEELFDFSGELTFLDTKGFHFYLPGYLRLMARELSHENASLDHLHSLWWILSGDSYYVSNHYSLLSEDQRSAVARVLTEVCDLGDWNDRREARSCLNYWNAYQPTPSLTSSSKQ